VLIHIYTNSRLSRKKQLASKIRTIVNNNDVNVNNGPNISHFSPKTFSKSNSFCCSILEIIISRRCGSLINSSSHRAVSSCHRAVLAPSTVTLSFSMRSKIAFSSPNKVRHQPPLESVLLASNSSIPGHRVHDLFYLVWTVVLSYQFSY
jgi:hypothetical protein